MNQSGANNSTTRTPHSTGRHGAIIRLIKKSWTSARTAQRIAQPLAQRFLTLSIFNFLAAGVFFLTQTTIANAIGRTQFGILAFGIALGIYAQCLVDFGQERSLVRDLVQHPERFHSLIMESLWFRCLLLGLLVITLLTWKTVNPAVLNWGIIAIIVAYALKSLDLQAVYDTVHAMGRHAGYVLFQRVLYSGLIALLLWLRSSELTITVVGVALLLSQLAYLAMQYRWIFRRAGLRVTQAVSMRGVLSQVRRGLWLCLSLLLYLTLHSLTQILIKSYAGSTELGGYAAAWQITMVAVLLIQYAARVGGPRLASVTCDNVDYRSQLRFLVSYVFTLLLLVLPIAGVLLYRSTSLMGVFYSKEYLGEARILYPMGIYTLLLGPGVVLEQFIVTIRMEWAYFLAMLISGILCILLGVTIIPSSGGYGAGWVLVLAYSAAVAVYLCAIIGHLRKMRRQHLRRAVMLDSVDA